MHEQHTPTGIVPRALHDALLRQLSVELAWLQRARESLIAVRRSAIVGDLTELDSALREQAVLTATRDDLAAARRTIFGQVAAQLGLDARSASLGVIAAQLPPAARVPVLAARRELIAGARGVRALAAGAFSIIGEKRLILDGVLSNLAGTAPTESRYTADGQRHDVRMSALVECRT